MKSQILLIAICFLIFTSIPTALFGAQNHPQLQSVKADFIQEKHLKILTNPIISKGTFTFQTPQSLRWEYTTPVPSILLMHGGQVIKFIERNGQFVEDRGMRLDSMQIVLSEISKWLNGRFGDNDMFSVSFPSKKKVLLVPKDKSMASLISKIELELANQQGLLNGVTIFEGPDSYTTMNFSNRVLNQKIPASVFTGK